MTKAELFLRLAHPDENGVSDWVDVTSFTGEYERLKLGNGGDWCRSDGPFQKKYCVEFDKSVTPGNRIDRIRLCGFKKGDSFNQCVRDDIRRKLRKQKCVMLGVCGSSANVQVEVDHKDGRKRDMRVSDVNTQRLSDFQPLCKAANDAKREICKKCEETGRRWDARQIEGNPFSFYKGGIEYTEELGCVGCYQYDPVAYRKFCVRELLQNNEPNAYEKIFPNR